MARLDEISATRRGFMGLAAGGAALAASGGVAKAAAKVRTSARIVVLGAGAAGTAIANRLADRLEGATITIIDGRQQHWYQPGFTLIAAGLRPASYSISDTGHWLPSGDGISWIAEYAAGLDPETRRVTTTSGQVVEYDYLIVATGLSLDWDAIEGFDLDMVGANGITAHYASPEHAELSWRELDRFTDTGGVGLFGRPATEMKCAGAPLKYAFIAEDIANRKGRRDAVEIVYNAHNQTLFGVPIVHHKVRQLFDERGIGYRYDHVLKAIDAGRKVATFATPEGDVSTEYDLINVIPPQRAPQVIRDSGLSWADRWTDQGWIEVDPYTLRHRRYANIFGVGDINGVPKGKTAASAKWHQPVVEDQLVSEIAGREATQLYNGYTSCPMITKIGRAMLVEFDYHDNLTPSFPGIISPLEELWISWLMEEIALKPTYNAMLQGRA